MKNNHKEKCACNSAMKTLAKDYHGKTITLSFTLHKKKGILLETTGTDNGALLLMLAQGYINNCLKEDIEIPEPMEELFHKFLYDAVELEINGEPSN